jgi:hypothetical protein
MNFDTQEALVGIILGISIILIIGSLLHLQQHADYIECTKSVATHMYNISSSQRICVKPGWWFGL